MLKLLKLHNFRTYLNAEIPLSERRLLIGANNSGKTNLCAALRLLRSTATTDLAIAALEVPGGISEITNWGFKSNKAELSVTCTLPFEGKAHDFTYELTVSVDTPSSMPGDTQVSLRVVHEMLVVDGPGFENVKLLESDGRQAHLLHEEDWSRWKKLTHADTLAPRDATMLSKLYELTTNRRATTFRRYLSSWQYYSLSPQAMRYGWRGQSNPLSVLTPHGDNLAYVVFQLKTMDESRYRRVIDQVRLVEPALKAVNFLPTPDQSIVPLVQLTDRPKASWHGLSDGTLRCFGLAVVAQTAGATFVDPPAYPPLAMIEEPENGVYPGLLRRFFEMFEDCPSGGQLIFTSHSPYFINFFDGDRDSVTLLRRKGERTEIASIPPADDDPDRLLLAEQYSSELLY